MCPGSQGEARLPWAWVWPTEHGPGLSPEVLCLHADIRTSPPKPPQLEQHAVRASGSGMKQTQAHSQATFGKSFALCEPQFTYLQNGERAPTSILRE